MNITSVCLFSRILRGSEVTGEPTICFLEHEPRVVLSLDLALPGPRHGLPREALLALHPLVSSASVSCSCKDDLCASPHHFHRVQCFKLLLSQTLHSNSRLSPASSRVQAYKLEMPFPKIRVCTVDLSPV